jgi:ribose-phosphate pyrophosphokinase
MPYFGYARQDARNRPGEPRSAQLAARVLRAAGIDRAVILELHSPALESAFDLPLTHLHADTLLVPAIKACGFARLTIVSPDAGGLKRAQRYASALGAPLAVIAKTRPAPDVSAALHVLGAVGERACLIVDDMASTGGTIAGAAEALLRAGAAEVHAVFVHAVMAAGALERMRSAGVGRLITTDSVPAANLDASVQVLSVAPLLAGAVQRLSAPRRSRLGKGVE